MKKKEIFSVKKGNEVEIFAFGSYKGLFRELSTEDFKMEEVFEIRNITRMIKKDVIYRLIPENNLTRNELREYLIAFLVDLKEYDNLYPKVSNDTLTYLWKYYQNLKFEEKMEMIS